MFARAYESHDPAVNYGVIRARAAHGEAVCQAFSALWRGLSAVRLRLLQPRHWGMPAHG